MERELAWSGVVGVSSACMELSNFIQCKIFITYKVSDMIRQSIRVVEAVEVQNGLLCFTFSFYF